MISALQSALGTDFGLAQHPGFLATADFMLHVAGPTGLFFNYSDSSRGDEAQRLVVHLVPGSAAPAQVGVAPLAAW
jgi:hypothetical protein